MKSKYRKDYSGEFVISEIRITNNAWREKREWIPNVIENHHISPRAAVIGTNNMQQWFDHRKLVNHRGGLQGRLRLQTYGTGQIWQDMRLQFYVSTNRRIIGDLHAQQYHKDTVVMTSGSICLAHPGDFYLVPHLPSMDDLALAVYLAAFDEHQEIFLIGYNTETQANTLNWLADTNSVFQQYPSCQFVIVGTEASVPELWRYNTNVQAMKVREFISYCDV